MKLKYVFNLMILGIFFCFTGCNNERNNDISNIYEPTEAITPTADTVTSAPADLSSDYPDISSTSAGTPVYASDVLSGIPLSDRIMTVNPDKIIVSAVNKPEENKKLFVPGSVFVDVVLNGKYIGNYNLTDVIENGNNRFIRNLTDFGFGYFVIELV